MTPTDEAIKALEELTTRYAGGTQVSYDVLQCRKFLHEHHKTIRTALQLLRQQRAQEVDDEMPALLAWLECVSEHCSDKAARIGAKDWLRIFKARTGHLSTPHPSPETAGKMVEALKVLGPFEVVQGDTIKRLQPHSQQLLNSSATWAVSSSDRSGHLIRKTVQELNEALALYEGETQFQRGSRASPADMKTAQERE